MKKLSFLSFLLIASVFAFGQNVPQKINYQAVAHDASGGILANQPLNVTIGVLSGSATGTLVYEETHNVSTNEHGLFYLKIGEGSVNVGAMNAISWGGADHFLSVNVNGDDLGTTQLVSVPYALVSKNTNGINGNGISNTAVNDGDVLVFNGTSGQWESQPSATGETTTTIVDNGNGTFTYTNEVGTPITFDANINDADADPINEIQDLQIIGDSLYITNNVSATTIDLSIYKDLPGVAATGDVLTWNGSSWVAGVDQVDDLDNDPSNEVVTSFALNGTSDSIILQDAGGVHVVPLSPNGELWSGSLGNVYPTTLTDNVGIGTTTPVSELDVMGNARLNDGKLMLGPVGGVNSGYTGVYEDGGDLKLAVFSGGAPTTNFGTNSIDAVTINSGNAYVGVGTINPLANFNVVGADPAHVARFENSNNAGSSSMIFADDAGAEQLYFGFANTGYSSLWNGHGYLNTVQDFVFAKNNGERMRLGAGGFGIGTNAPDATLDVVGNFQLDDGTQGAGYVLTSDANGNASWQAMATASGIQDLTGDTYVETDINGLGTIDEIDFNIAGTNNFKMKHNRIEFLGADGSIYLGELAGDAHVAGVTSSNVFVGTSAGRSNNAGYHNVFVGHTAGENNLSGNNNVAMGSFSLGQSVTANDNVSIGYGSQGTNISASENVSVGGNALGGASIAGLSGGQNTAVGNGALYVNETGSGNVAMGLFALAANTTGTSNTSLGYGSASSNITGSNITTVGNGSDVGASALNNATAIGANAIVNQSNSLVLGNNANVGIGTTAPASILNIVDDVNAQTAILLENNTAGTGASAEFQIKNDASEYSKLGIRSSSTTPYGALLPNTSYFYTGASAFTIMVDDPSGVIQFATGGNAAGMLFDQAGNLGIGTITPAAKLDVVGSVKITDGTQGAGKVLTSDAAGNATWQDANAKIAFYAGNDFTNSPAGDTIPAGGAWTTMIFGDGGGPSYLYFNEGGAYSLATGQFNAPVPGVYQLNTNLDLRGAPGTQVIVNLRSATTFMGQQMVTLDANGKGSVSMSATVRSDKGGGGISWVELASFGSYVVVDPYYSSFSGHLVYKL